MAARGRGRGRATMSISAEQLGFGKGEALPPPVLQPPPKYPPLEYKPLPLTFTNEENYLLLLKKDFAQFTRASHCNVKPILVRKDIQIERYSDRHKNATADSAGYESRYDWDRLPSELKPATRRRKASGSRDAEEPRKKRLRKSGKEVDVESKLTELEKKESSQQSDVEEEEKEEGETEEKEVDEHIEEEEDEPDEEMDAGTDYVNNYFDNGEGYDDEDENLDDGPIY